MTVGKGRRWPESHLLPDAVAAFVDQELSLGAQERAAAHLAHCPRCAAEVAAQRAASEAVRQARTPSISASFLASLQRIPQTADLPNGPDNLAIGPNGQVMAVQRPDHVAGLRDGLPSGALGTSAPLGTSPTVLGNGPRLAGGRKRATQGAGVVVSGLVLSALALVATTNLSEEGARDADPSATPRTDVLPAKFGGHAATDTLKATPLVEETGVAPAESTEPSEPLHSSEPGRPSGSAETSEASEASEASETTVTSTVPTSIGMTVSSTSATPVPPSDVVASATTGAVIAPPGVPH